VRLLEALVGVAEEDEAENRDGVEDFSFEFARSFSTASERRLLSFWMS